jgi:death-on-curing protein
LESAVFRPQTGYYNDLSEEAAALLESLVNNHPLLDGNDRVGFAAVHTFLLVNGFDLAVTSKAAFEFMMKTMAEGKFRFSRIHEWISAHLCRLPCNLVAAHARFGTLFTTNLVFSSFLRFALNV